MCTVFKVLVGMGGDCTKDILSPLGSNRDDVELREAHQDNGEGVGDEDHAMGGGEGDDVQAFGEEASDEEQAMGERASDNEQLWAPTLQMAVAL